MNKFTDLAAITSSGRAFQGPATLFVKKPCLARSETVSLLHCSRFPALGATRIGSRYQFTSPRPFSCLYVVIMSPRKRLAGRVLSPSRSQRCSYGTPFRLCGMRVARLWACSSKRASLYRTGDHAGTANSSSGRTYVEYRLFHTRSILVLKVFFRRPSIRLAFIGASSEL